MDNGKKWAIGLSMALIGFDVLTIYFVVDLFGYDELLDHFTPDGSVKSESPRGLARLLFVNGLCNLLFVSATLMAWLMDPDNS
ncbi:hypothetical protein SAMN04487891_102393 [Flagellimonas taeanensis]|uniref:Uncharacterized protein n=1 Tax=Flagellimonas taeanensis TaxID=1005926 RepID=A0A1M6SBT1_9FLAO|nr:hypothetical protein [Allomuricauda taeanensis]SFB79823.1 hypothetical protein SAMN04487891_102393 [Allomuricauda taeanensis]SHK42213.1 hypothetical protein SAMN05216293_1072 [Allomuricauda taeanensis]